MQMMGVGAGGGRIAISRRRLLSSTLAALSLAVTGGCTTLPATKSAAPQLHVMTSGAFSAAFDALSARYTKQTGVRIVTAHGPSMGDTPVAIPSRLGRGEPADVVILAREALDKLAKGGKIVPGSERDLVLSKIAVAVKDGSPVPDISTPEALRAALVAAHSVAWSDSASGVYVQSVMLPRLGIAAEVMAKGKMIPATPVGEIVARGEAEIGFQQLSELKPVKGIRIVGLIPDSLQKVTAFSGGIVSYSVQPKPAKALLEYLASPKAYGVISASGLEPVSQKVKP